MRIHLQTLGPPRCYADGALTDLSTQKLRFALLMYLGVQRRAARDSVIALFWPERDEDRARRSLAQTIFELRRTLGYEWMLPRPDPLEVTEHVTVDALEFVELVNAHEFERALSLYSGQFLDGFHLKDSNAFDTWMESKRRELKRLYDRAAEQHIERLAAGGKFDRAIAASQDWVGLDPLHDDANHLFIRSLADAGKVSEADAHYEIYRRRVKEELDVTPLPATIEIIKALREKRRHPRTNLRGDPVTSLPVLTSPVKSPSPVQAEPSAFVKFLAELQRRGVLRVGWIYLVVLYAALQGGLTIVELFTWPKWPVAILAVIGAVAFPLTIVVSWQFDLTPEGLLPDSGQFSIRERLARANWKVVTAALAATTTVAVIAARPDEGGPIEDVTCAGPVCPRPVEMVPDRLVVLPLSHSRSMKSVLLDGETCARLLSQGLSYWDDVNVVEQARLSQPLAQLTKEQRSHIPLEKARSIAKIVGAGKLVLGDMWEIGDTTRLEANLFDTRRGVLLARRAGRFPSNNPLEAEREFQRLAQQLVIALTGLKVRSNEVVSTRSLSAALLYDSAQKSILRWELASAKTYLAKSLEKDPEYPHANLWLAYTLMWQRQPRTQWHAYAQRATSGAHALGVIDKLLATAVNDLSNGRFVAACDQYRQILERDSSTFYGWYGLGACLSADTTVIKDERSASGFSFATSRWEAIKAHTRALQLVPVSANATPQVGPSALSSILFLAQGRYRPGASDTLTFGAWPDLAGDTVSVVPYPYEVWRTSAPPSNAALVVAQHRKLIADVARDWAGTFNENPSALLGFADVLERQDIILPRRNSPNSALGMVRRARRFARDTSELVRTEVSEVRLLVKSGQFAKARKRASTALRKYRNATGNDAVQLAGIAGLIGRPHKMAELLNAATDTISYDHVPTTVQFEVPPSYARTLLPLLAYASVGAPADSFRTVLNRAHEALRLFVPPEHRQLVHAATLDRAERLMFVAIGAQDLHEAVPLPAPATPALHYTMPQLQRMLMRGDTVGVRRVLAEIENFRADKPPAEYASDILLTRAELSLAIGDTAGAVRIIDPFLNDLQHYPRDQFNHQWQPAAVVRLMVLRSELAARSGQRVVAKKWARAAYDLWRSGDRAMNAQLQRLRYLRGL